MLVVGATTYQTKKVLIHILKGAKTFLSYGAPRDDWARQDASGKVWCICYAITDYLVSVYGLDAAIYGEKAGVRCKAHEHIQRKMQELVEAPYTYFREEHARAVLGDEYDASSYDYMQKQKARHLWLDLLIKELECST